MLDHFGIHCSDLPAAAAFYDKVPEVLGYTRQMDFGVAIGYGTAGKPDFWIGGDPDGQASTGPNREIHVAFSAASIEKVDEFFATATGEGKAPLIYRIIN